MDTEALDNNTYDFGKEIIEINSSVKNRRYFTYRINKPSNEQWLKWGEENYTDLIYFTAEEVAAENEMREGEEELVVGQIYRQISNEYSAAHQLFSEIAIDVTEHIVDQEGEIVNEVTVPMTPEQLNRGIYDRLFIINTIGNFHCWLDDDKSDLKENEVRVLQKVGQKGDGFSEEFSGIYVNHILEQLTEEEKELFQKKSVVISKLSDEPKKYRTQHNYEFANDIYNSKLIRIENAVVRNEKFDESTKSKFLDAISPVVKFQIIKKAIGMDSITYIIVNDALQS